MSEYYSLKNMVGFASLMADYIFKIIVVVVNLDIHDCRCRKWMLTGIPYCHALSTMKFVNVDAVNFI